MANFRHELQSWQPGSSAIKAHLLRWVDDDRADNVWKSVSKAAGANLTAGEFIRHVAWTAMASRALPARLENYKQEIAAVKTGWGGRVAEAFASNKSGHEIADILEEAACQLRFREKFARLENYPEGAISRSRISQSRRAFSLAMSDFFIERCGKWMDNEAGVLLEIALGPKGDDISQEVRDYRKSRAKKVGD